MDATLQGLYDLLPAQYRPYVVLGLIVLYVITKWRSSSKTAQLNSHKKEFLSGIPEQGFFSKIVDLVF